MLFDFHPRKIELQPFLLIIPSIAPRGRQQYVLHNGYIICSPHFVNPLLSEIVQLFQGFIQYVEIQNMIRSKSPL